MTRSTRSQRQLEHLRGTFVEALGQASDSVLRLRPQDYARPAGLPGWDVRLLLGLGLWQLTEMGHQLERPSVTRPVTLERYAALQLASMRRRREQAADIADGDAGPHLVELLAARADEVAAAVRDSSLPPMVDTGAGQLSLVDYLRVHVTEVVVFIDDLQRVLAASGVDAPAPGRGPTATAVRALADVLAVRVPGQAIEVRVPPHAAVQIGDPTGPVTAPRHTRGTPPAVIEMAPLAFLRLASGRMSWDEATSGHEVQASGLRADLSPVLPLVP